MGTMRTITRRALPFIIIAAVVAVVAIGLLLRPQPAQRPANQPTQRGVRVTYEGYASLDITRMPGVTISRHGDTYEMLMSPGDYICVTSSSEAGIFSPRPAAYYPWQGAREVLFSADQPGVIDVSADGGATSRRLSMDLRDDSILAAFMSMSAGDDNVPLQVCDDAPSRAVLEQVSKLGVQGATFMAPPADQDLSRLPDMKFLSIGHCADLPDLDFLSHMGSLGQLELVGISGKIDLHVINDLPSLERLLLTMPTDILSGTMYRFSQFEEERLGLDVSSFKGLSRVTTLRTLSIFGGYDNESSRGQWLARFPNLRTLELRAYDGRIDLDQLKNTPSLERLVLEDIGAMTNMRSLGRLRRLQHLTIAGTSSSARALSLPDMPSLQTLILRGYCLSDLDDLKSSTSLTILGLCNLGNATSLDDIAELTELECLSLGNGGRLVDIDALSGLSHLRTLDLQYLPQLTKIDSIGTLESLEDLTIIGCDSIESFAPVARLKALKLLTTDKHAGDKADEDFEATPPQSEFMWSGIISVPY